MDGPRISVVMVTCNVERFLAESIESILGQTFTAFEFIIVDFGSTDKNYTHYFQLCSQGQPSQVP